MKWGCPGFESWSSHFSTLTLLTVPPDSHTRSFVLDLRTLSLVLIEPEGFNGGQPSLPFLSALGLGVSIILHHCSSSPHFLELLPLSQIAI